MNRLQSPTTLVCSTYKKLHLVIVPPTVPPTTCKHNVFYREAGRDTLTCQPGNTLSGPSWPVNPVYLHRPPPQCMSSPFTTQLWEGQRLILTVRMILSMQRKITGLALSHLFVLLFLLMVFLIPLCMTTSEGPR